MRSAIEDLLRAAIKKSGSRPGPTLNFSLLAKSYEMSLSAHIGERRPRRKAKRKPAGPARPASRRAQARQSPGKLFTGGSHVVVGVGLQPAKPALPAPSAGGGRPDRDGDRRQRPDCGSRRSVFVVLRVVLRRQPSVCDRLIRCCGFPRDPFDRRRRRPRPGRRRLATPGWPAARALRRRFDEQRRRDFVPGVVGHDRQRPVEAFPGSENRASVVRGRLPRTGRNPVFPRLRPLQPWARRSQRSDGGASLAPSHEA